MSTRRSGLGRGLGALIPAQQQAGAGAGALREVPLGRIRANQFQPRRHFDEEALSSLVDSIRVVGVLQPVLLREVSDGEYELIAGERRCRAARRAGLQSVPALVQPATDASSLEQALIENLHREDLNALEEAAAYKQLIEEFELTHEEVARRVGRSRAAVSNSLRLFQLPPSVQRLVRDRALSAGHARALLGTPDRELQERLAQRATEEQLPVRAVEELVRQAVAAATAGIPSSWAAGATGAIAPVAPSEPPPPAPTEPPGSVSAGPPEAVVRALWAEAPAGAPGSRFASPRRDGSVVEPAAGSAKAGRAAFEQEPIEPGAGTPAGTGSAPGLRPPGVLELEELLADHLNTRVRVDMGGKHGRVLIEFANLEDLERIYRVMIGDAAAR